MDFFDVHKGQFDSEIPLLKNVSKQEAAEVLSIIWDHINHSDIIEAFDQSICSYFDDINEDDNYNEDIEFEKKLKQFDFELQRYQFQLKQFNSNSPQENQENSLQSDQIDRVN